MSVKIASTDHPILDLLAQRWSPRAFSERRIASADLDRLFEAARWAPSCFGEQPWSFVVAPMDDAEAHQRLGSCLSPGNAWALKAPVLALSVASLNFSATGKPNRFAYHDVGLAVGNLLIQALSMGIYSHQMAGFDVEKARQLCEIPPGHDPVAMIALGYLGDPATLTEDQRKKETTPRQRKPLAQFVFSGKWGESRSTQRGARSLVE